MVPPGRKDSAEEFVIEDDEEDDDEYVEVGVKKGNVERYEVQIGPPMVRGRKVKPIHSEGEVAGAPPSSGPRVEKVDERSGGRGFASAANPQQIYKIEDDLRRTRDKVEDMSHTLSVLDGEVKELMADMERMSYLVRSLEGMKNTMRSMETTVSELSGLYDLISANVNPFIDIPPMKMRGSTSDEGEDVECSELDIEKFRSLSDIFEEEEEEKWGRDLDSEESIIKWTKFLLERVGKEGLDGALEYYLDLGWIDDDLVKRVKEVARGMSSPPRPRDGKRSSWKMDADEHVESLGYIKKITG